jgi:hypothetical protein
MKEYLEAKRVDNGIGTTGILELQTILQPHLKRLH